MCKCANGRLYLHFSTNAAKESDHLHICTFSHLHINKAFSHSHIFPSFFPMRIITGKYKGRHFEVPRTFKARPTTDFAKENLFNVLRAYVDFEDVTALDLFGGTGSISLELVSRGC